MISNFVRPFFKRTDNTTPSQPKFTQNWFLGDTDEGWKTWIHPYKGKPGIKYLEIGSYEGRSLFWMVDNILTHPTSNATAIDPLVLPSGPRLRENIQARRDDKEKIKLIVGFSDIAMRSLPNSYFDIILIDGAHDMRSVLYDAVNSWYCLKPGGIIIFDDYKMAEGKFPDDLRPEFAVDSFILGFKNEIEVLHKNYQVIIRKKKSLISRVHSETHVGPFAYDWYSGELSKLYFKATIFNKHLCRKMLMISESERKLLEAILRLQENGTSALTIPKEFFELNAVVRMANRIGIPFRIES